MTVLGKRIYLAVVIGLLCIPALGGFAYASSGYDAAESTAAAGRSDPESLATDYLDEYLWEVYMYAEGDYTPYMTLGSGAGTFVSDSVSAEELSILQTAEANMHYIEGKAAYWRTARLAYGTMRNHYSVFYTIRESSIQEKQAKIEVSAIVSFYYEGEKEKSLAQSIFEISMAKIGDRWIITDVFEPHDWFDAAYKNDPAFDADTLINETVAAISAGISSADSVDQAAGQEEAVNILPLKIRAHTDTHKNHYLSEVYPTAALCAPIPCNYDADAVCIN